MGRRSQLKAHHAHKKTVRVFGFGMDQVVRFTLAHFTKVQQRLIRYDHALMSRALTIEIQLGGRKPQHMYPMHCWFEMECQNNCSGLPHFVSIWDCSGTAIPCAPYNKLSEDYASYLNDESFAMMARNPHRWKWLLDIEKLSYEALFSPDSIADFPISPPSPTTTSTSALPPPRRLNLADSAC
jgi:hypothetical protein